MVCDASPPARSSLSSALSTAQLSIPSQSAWLRPETCTVTQETLTSEDLKRLKLFDRTTAPPAQEREPIIVVEIEGVRHVIDGRRRVMQWIREGSTQSRSAINPGAETLAKMATGVDHGQTHAPWLVLVSPDRKGRGLSRESVRRQNSVRLAAQRSRHRERKRHDALVGLCGGVCRTARGPTMSRFLFLHEKQTAGFPFVPNWGHIPKWRHAVVGDPQNESQLSA